MEKVVCIFNDLGKTCNKPVKSEAVNFCDQHYFFTRALYRKYKKSEKTLQSQCNLNTKQLLKLYASTEKAIKCREKFTQLYVHCLYQDEGHSKAIDFLVSMLTQYEELLSESYKPVEEELQKDEPNDSADVGVRRVKKDSRKTASRNKSKKPVRGNKPSRKEKVKNIDDSDQVMLTEFVNNLWMEAMNLFSDLDFELKDVAINFGYLLKEKRIREFYQAMRKLESADRTAMQKVISIMEPKGRTTEEFCLESMAIERYNFLTKKEKNVLPFQHILITDRMEDFLTEYPKLLVEARYYVKRWGFPTSEKEVMYHSLKAGQYKNIGRTELEKDEEEMKLACERVFCTTDKEGILIVEIMFRKTDELSTYEKVDARLSELLGVKQGLIFDFCIFLEKRFVAFSISSAKEEVLIEDILASKFVVFEDERVLIDLKGMCKVIKATEEMKQICNFTGIDFPRNLLPQLAVAHHLK